MEFSIQNHAFWKSTKRQFMSFWRSKKNQNVICCIEIFVHNLKCWITFTSKSNALYFFQYKIWRVVSFLNQNLTICENFVSKSDAFENFNPKSEKFWIFFTRIFFSVFLFLKVLTEWWYLLSTLKLTYFKEEN